MLLCGGFTPIWEYRTGPKSNFSTVLTPSTGWGLSNFYVSIYAGPVTTKVENYPSRYGSERYLGSEQDIAVAVNDNLGI